MNSYHFSSLICMRIVGRLLRIPCFTSGIWSFRNFLTKGSNSFWVISFPSILEISCKEKASVLFILGSELLVSFMYSSERAPQFYGPNTNTTPGKLYAHWYKSSFEFADRGIRTKNYKNLWSIYWSVIDTKNLTRYL